MLKIGDKVKFISAGKLEESFKKYGCCPSSGDIEKQKMLQGITDYIVGFDDVLCVFLRYTKDGVGYYHIARLEKINTGIVLNDNLFEL